MKKYRLLLFVLLFFVGFLYKYSREASAANCPFQGDAGSYLEPSDGKCYSKKTVGFNTVDPSNTFSCGPVQCPGTSGGLPTGNTCIYPDTGKCYTGYGGSGYNPSICTYNEPAPTPVTCPTAMPLAIRVADANNNGIPNVSLKIHYEDVPPVNTGGKDTTVTTDNNGNVTVNGTLYMGDHFTITATGPYVFVNNGWAVNNGTVIGNETDLGTEEMDTNWTCGQTLKNGTVTTPCLFTVATHTISGSIFVDSNGNGTKDSGENNYSSSTVTVQATGQNTGKTYSTTTSNGSYTFSNILADTYNVSITTPNGYQMTSANPSNGIDITTQDATTNFGVSFPNSISGVIYNDTNGDQHMDNGEKAVTGSSTVTITNSSNVVVKTINTNDGTYTTGAILPAGTYTVSYTTLPAGYYVTYPLSGSPPSFTVTVGGSGACKPTAYNDEVCNY